MTWTIVLLVCFLIVGFNLGMWYAYNDYLKHRKTQEEFYDKVETVDSIARKT
jgi:hypothetical protein